MLRRRRAQHGGASQSVGKGMLRRKIRNDQPAVGRSGASKHVRFAWPRKRFNGACCYGSITDGGVILHCQGPRTQQRRLKSENSDGNPSPKPVLQLFTRFQHHQEHQTRTADRLQGLEVAVLSTLARMDAVSEETAKVQQHYLESQSQHVPA